jgi:hypothetical protein
MREPNKEKTKEMGRASMALSSHAALSEIRDSLLETYAANDAMNQLILAHLDSRAWHAQPPGEKSGGLSARCSSRT